jgi:enoyl-CoA hydratase/carnithine racemase
MSPHITTSVDDRILRVGIARPEKKNALTREMYAALVAALKSAASDPAIRVVLVHGTGDCFTSGNDLKDFLAANQNAGGNAPGVVDESGPVFQFLAAINTFPKPLVAAVNGPAVGIGTTLLLHCDLVFAGESARFQLPFANLGLCPEAASSLLLPKLAGYHRAAEILLLGEPFSAASAREIGLVNHVHPDDDVLTAALAASAKLAQQPPGAIRVTKSLMKARQADAIRAVMRTEFTAFAERLQSAEAREALTAFFEKRRPDFSRFE